MTEEVKLITKDIMLKCIGRQFQCEKDDIDLKEFLVKPAPASEDHYYGSLLEANAKAVIKNQRVDTQYIFKVITTNKTYADYIEAV